MVYELSKLPYDYKALSPFISEEQLTIHHQKHHQSYVNECNAIIDKLSKARKDNSELDFKALLKALSFNLSGHALHSLFWNNLAPASSSSKMKQGAISTAIKDEFGSFDRFKMEFSAAAQSVEGSGWAVLAFDKISGKLLILQVEKHNVNLIPSLNILLVIDVWEHAYYLDYKNLRAKFIEAFWKIINWDEVNKRYKELK